MQEQYRIHEYYAENFKKLKFVQFTPKGRVTIFTGKNDQGKSSAIEAIPFVLGGKKHSPEMPMRRGAKKMKVKLNLGEFTVERTESGMTLKPAPGCSLWDTPQKMLDQIFDELAFDPLEFVRMKPIEQVEMLRKSLRLNEKIDPLDQENTIDFDARKLINKEIDQLTANIATFIVQPDLPKERVDEAKIEQLINNAGELNRECIAQIEAKAKAHARVGEAQEAELRHAQFLTDTEAKIDKKRNEAQIWEQAIPVAQVMVDQLEEFHKDAQKLLHADVALIPALYAALLQARGYLSAAQQNRENAGKDWEQLRLALEAGHQQTKATHKAVAEAYDAWEAIPAGKLIDTNELMQEYKQAQLINREIDKRTRLQQIIEERETKIKDSERLTRAIRDRQEKKDAIIAKAKLPVEGLTFTEGDVLFDGVPIQQLGEAKQIKISVALVLARQPKLRLCLIKHGEALDDDSLAELAAMAEEMDFYIWMAKVDTTGKVGIFLEDGEVKTNNE